jgi:hypothetical protein
MWMATLDDGTVVGERDRGWGEIRSRVVRLSLVSNGRQFSLPDRQPEYMQAKTASVPLAGGVAEIESRWIACRTAGGSVVRLRVDEKTGNASIEVE